jgi:hypothetical protein
MNKSINSQKVKNYNYLPIPISKLGFNDIFMRNSNNEFIIK